MCLRMQNSGEQRQSDIVLNKDILWNANNIIKIIKDSFEVLSEQMQIFILWHKVKPGLFDNVKMKCHSSRAHELRTDFKRFGAKMKQLTVT